MPDEETDDAVSTIPHEGERIVPRSELDPFDSADIDRYLSVETAAALPDVVEVEDISDDYEGLRISVRQQTSRGVKVWRVVTLDWDNVKHGAVLTVDGVGKIETGSIKEVCESRGESWEANDV